MTAAPADSDPTEPTGIVMIDTHVQQLPSLTSTDHDNAVMMLEGEPNSNSRTVSPLLRNNSSESFDQKHTDGWDDVVIMDCGNSSDHDEDHIIRIDEDRKPPLSPLFLDSATTATSNNKEASIDEFLVGSKKEREAELQHIYNTDFWVPRPKSLHAKEVSFASDISDNNSGSSNANVVMKTKPPKTLQAKTPKPGPPMSYYHYTNHPNHTAWDCCFHPDLALPSLSNPPTPTPTYRSINSFEQIYRKRLYRLEESMYQSRKSRKSLRMSSPHVTERYARRKSVSQVLYHIERTTHQINTCYLDPKYAAVLLPPPPPQQQRSTTSRKNPTNPSGPKPMAVPSGNPAREESTK
ncbi:expressed unknown protein [Seminavis robusta]|uniref:Uncharacterized protein n=1 Tax=Seminavis robusta TaxID=568900 RepID=A0A9N8HQQ1_9STRA|nr:expressed unknown protein [Seminavis robusta]|eukprot:Sro1469_g275310.1 n/a (351) ;mRNA; f:7864-8916